MKDQRIKVLFVCSNLGQGGAEKQFVELILGLNKRIFDVNLLLYAKQSEPFFFDRLIKSEINIKTNSLKNNFSIFKIIEALRHIRRVLKDEKFDLVISTLFMNNLFVRIIAPKRYKNKIVTSMRTSPRNYSWAYKLCERILIKNSFIVFNSFNSLNEFKLIINKKFHNRFYLIYNGFKIPININNDSKRYKIYGFLGRISVEKNPIQIVRVFENYNLFRKKYKLVMKGSRGNQYDEIVSNYKNSNLIFEEPSTNTEIFFNSIDVLIISSVFEGCPNVLFEAMLRKKLCIISVGANSDNFVKNLQNGITYDGSDKDLFRAIKDIEQIIGTSKIDEILSNAYDYSKNKFNMDFMIEQYQSLFETIYEKNKSCN